MSAELTATIIGTAVTITALALTILYSNKTMRKTLREGQNNTQRIIEKGSKNTQEILKGHNEILKENRKVSERHDKFLRGMVDSTYKIAELTGKAALLSVVDFGLRGIRVADNVENEEDAKKLGELIVYHPGLKFACYRQKRSDSGVAPQSGAK